MKRTVITLANQLVGKGMNRSLAMKAAYEFCKENEGTKVLKFFKKGSDKLTTRVIHRNIAKFVELAGGSTTNFHTKFVDVAKLLTGERHCIISAIGENIVSLAA